MPELLVPAHVAEKRRADIASQTAGTVPVVNLKPTPEAPSMPVQRGRGLGKSVHKEDPAAKIYAQMGIPVKKSGKYKGQPVELNRIPGYHVAGNRVIIAVYERPESIQLAGGHEFFLPDQTRREDEHQGKAGLIIAMGQHAFKSDDQYDFGEDANEFKPGVWVAIYVSDGRKIVINGQLCRLVEDQHIILKIPAPDSVW